MAKLESGAEAAAFASGQAAASSILQGKYDGNCRPICVNV